jgi:chromosome segregation protein
MRVKKLEILGFKSFANKTTVHFEPGVTAIVGPNGSGKSNIVDSIRWVLGEHNPRDVRAPRLEDVIFNGTDKKAPLSMAEVSLTIANEQGLLPIAFSEVTITRRVYRSGESECLINQSPCRLKDIHELFLGTGLGGGTYAIIEQGHIDMILSSKPEERRVVFEEASGVAKYLAKKHETMRRLDETEEHLVRIADIVGEVRRQVGALERAANKARQYKNQWEELKSLELRLVVDELGSGHSREQELETKVRGLEAARDELEGKKQAHVTSLEAANASISAIAGRLQELRTNGVACASDIQQHEGQLALKMRWIEELSQQIQQADAEAAELRQRAAQLDEQLARVSGAESEIEVQLAAVEAQRQEGAAELAALEAAVQAALETLAQAKRQLFEAASGAAEQRNRLAALASRIQGVETQINRIEAQRVQRASHADGLRRRSQTAFDEHAVLQRKCDDAHRRLTAAQGRLDEASARRHELTGRLQGLRDRLAGERARAGLLEDLWQRYEGFPDTVKTLMTRHVDGLIGPLVDLVHPEPGFEPVVEAALGPLAEALVVRDREALSRCRRVLQEQGLDGCRFLVLADCPAALSMEPASVREGVAGAVKQYVKADAQYQPLVDWLLNDSWVIDDIDRLLGQSEPPQGRLVTHRGERWDRRSWRFGRAVRADVPSRFGRKQRWEQAHAAVQALDQEFRRVEVEFRDAEQHWQSCLSGQEAAKGELAHAAPALHKLDAQATQLAREVERIEEEQRACERELQELTAQRDQLQSEMADAEALVSQSQEHQQALERALTEAQTARETSDQRRQQLLVAQAQVESSRQSLAERLDASRSRRAELDADKASLLRQIDAKAARRQDAARRTEELTQQLDEHRQSMQRLGDERVRVDAEAAAVSQTLAAEEATREQLLPHLLAAEQKLSGIMRQLQDQAQQLSERAYRRTHLVERLRELYQIDQSVIDAERRANAPPLTEEQRAEMTGQVQKFRAKLEGIGPVSLGSVEEYDELKRRLDFLSAQQQDLVQARDDLKTSITQINRTARTQFRETFERIKQEFQHYYTRLFNGGEANLILMDEEDVLECGIDIVARPPGKRLQSISLLSGGERALTAVALLFALFKVRPSPFCILDEIDAPLDEANVDRFTRVLEEFLALSQFILVTHNKKTITKADSLYGVTMEEAGISKILSAKLGTGRQSVAPAAVPA